MVKHKRHPNTQTETHQQIEWFKHRTGYPTPEERDKIINLRQRLMMEIIKLAILKVHPNDARYRSLIKKYGEDEIIRAERSFRESMESPSRVADDASSYRDYRLRYSRYGEGLQFYTSKEVDELYISYGSQLKDLLDNGGNGNEVEPEENISKLLLIGWKDWEDITPPAIPPRPIDFIAPTPTSYSAPLTEILEYGWDLEKEYMLYDPANRNKWGKHISALTHMALDPGLLNGWPSENASWAPWHAVHMLGLLEAWESAPALAQLADHENDWLSDHLPHIWADMGMEVEPTLWMILENPTASAKQRGLAAESLYMLTDENEAMEYKVIKGFEKILKNTKTFNPELNGFLIMFLKDMEALDDMRDTIDLAFEEERVDLSIIGPENLEEDDFDDELDDEDNDDED
ncbi:MAG: hypothetical protein MUO77_10520 [Anaerolineales bacterium]|nr:hypothetical protein [Anaerolineales bacterium]